MSTKITAVDADAQVQALAAELSRRGFATSVTGDGLHHHHPCARVTNTHVARMSEDVPAASRLRDALCPGSYIVISHATNEGRNDDALTEITDTSNQATALLVMRSYDDIARFFHGLDLVKPEVVFLSQWRPSSESYPEGGTRWAYAGVGRKG